jgi:hypothetical protein
MSKEGEIFYIRSDKDTHFTGALAQNAGETEFVPLPTDVATLGITSFVIENVSVQSDENLDWDIFVWRNNAVNADLDLNEFVDYVSLANGDGKQIAGTAQYYYPSADLDINFKLSNPRVQSLPCGVVNRNAAAKTAGAGGEIVVQFTCRIIR